MWIIFLLIFLLSSCSIDGRTVINRGNLTEKEEKAIVGQYSEFGDRFKGANKKEHDKVKLKLNNVNVIQGASPALPVKANKCNSVLRFSGFTSTSLTLNEIIAYLRTNGVDVKLVAFDNVKQSDLLTEKYNRKIILNFPRGASLCEIVDEIHNQTGLYTYIDSGKELVISPYMRKIYRMPVPLGNNSSKASFSSGTTGKYDMLKLSSDTNIQVVNLKEIDERLKLIIGNDGFYLINESVGLITVFSLPEKINIVDSYISKIAEEYSKMVRLYVTIFDVTEESGKQAGVDWSTMLRRAIITKPWLYGLTSEMFDINIAMKHDLEIRNPVTIGIQSVEAPEIHKFIFNLLKTKVNANLIESTNLMLANGQSTIISKGISTEYISEMSRAITEGTNEVNYSVQKGQISSGLKLFCSGLIREETITLTFYIELQDLIDLQTLTFGNYITQNPTVEHKHHVLTIQLKNGETNAIVGVASDRKKRENKGLGGVLDYITGGVQSDESKKYFVILITSQLVENNSGGVYEFN